MNGVILAEDGKPLDYVADGIQWTMCACGHRVGNVESGSKVALCPNCTLRARIGESIVVVYPDRLPASV